MISTPLKILLVSRDQAMLVSLSKFLDLLGFEALQAADPRQASVAAASERPDLLILDAALLAHGGRELCRAVCGGGMRSHVFTLLLTEEQTSLAEIVEALKLGVDDFLSRPIVFGELLARLRSAARGLEYERRVQAYLGTDPLLGLPNANAFCQALRAALEEPGCAGSVAVVAIDLDFFDRLNYMYGRPEADETLRSVAKMLEKACHATDIAASCGDDKFWVLLPDKSEADAGQWAEHFRAALADSSMSVGVVTETITASLGVTAAAAGTCTAQEVMERADEALQAAKRSGRNCVILRTALDDESNAWTNLGAPGKLFDRTMARDVMAPCTVFLRPDEPAAHAAAMLKRTWQSALTVVDRDGNLVGLVTAEEVGLQHVGGDPPPASVADLMTTDPQRFAEEATFAELVSFFSQFERSLAVIVVGAKPVGIVTRTALAALSEPLCVESFSAECEDEPTSDSLTVPDACTIR